MEILFLQRQQNYNSRLFKLTPGKLKVFDYKNKKIGISKEIELPILEIDKYSDFFKKHK